MIPRKKRLKAFLSRDGFPERGTGRPVAVAIVGLTSSLSSANRHCFPSVLPFAASRTVRLPATPEELPSFHKRGQAPPLFHRIRRSFRQRLIDWRYRRESPRGGRSRTFTGQCCQPFCPGDPTSHFAGPRTVTKSRYAKELNRTPKASACLGDWPTSPAET